MKQAVVLTVVFFSSQYTMERGIVHACHAGGIVHCLEGWTHHEVGAIDVDRIDVVWNAALKHGLQPVWHMELIIHITVFLAQDTASLYMYAYIYGFHNEKSETT